MPEGVPKRPARMGTQAFVMWAANADQPPAWPADFRTEDGRRWVLDLASVDGPELIYTEA